jgi:hypothetical protein
MAGTTTPAGAMPAADDATSSQTAGTEPGEPAATADAAIGDAGQRAIKAERTAAREALKRAEAAERELEALRTANLSEQEKRDKRLAELELKQTEWQRERQDMVLASSVERAAVKLGFADPDDALGLLDRSAIVFEDDGRPRNVERLLAELAKGKPYLLARRALGSADAGQLGAAPNPTTFSRAQLRDPEFFRAHKAEILRAQAEGRITG